MKNILFLEMEIKTKRQKFNFDYLNISGYSENDKIQNTKYKNVIKIEKINSSLPRLQFIQFNSIQSKMTNEKKNNNH